MAAILEELVAVTRQAMAEAKSRADAGDLERRANAHAPRGFRHALERIAAEGVAVIAELKKASPSRGTIRQDFPVRQLAEQLESAGAAALSVLTEERFFQGTLQNLAEASRATHLPCLRKDFIIDPFQLLEAKAHDADAVLLILAILSDAEFTALHRRARELGLDALCEVHDRHELRRALDLGAEIIGVNNRDLRTFRVDIGTALRLAGEIPPNVLKVAESGIDSAGEIRGLRGVGYQAFLIGESLMRAASPGDELRTLLTTAREAGVSRS